MSPTAAKAIREPSGEITGRTIPSALRGVVEVKSRARRVYWEAARVTGIVAVNSTVCIGRPAVERRRILPSETYRNSVADAHETRNAKTFSLPVTGLPSISR